MDSGAGSYITLFGCDEKSEMMDSLCDEKEMFPVVRIPFEDMSICIQKNYNEILTALYGDYMKLPPEEDRKIGHSVIDVTLDKPFDWYFKDGK